MQKKVLQTMRDCRELFEMFRPELIHISECGPAYLYEIWLAGKDIVWDV